MDVVALTLRPIPKQRAVIFDMDGTLVSAAHRVHYVEGEPGQNRDWTSFHEQMVRDANIPEMVEALKQHHAAGDKIILLTLRPERFRKIVEDDLKRRGIPYDALFLRPEGDYRPGVEMKRKIYRESIKPFYDVKMTYDDWDQINAMWEEEGLPTTHVDDPELPPLDVKPVEDPRKHHNGTSTGSGEYGSLEEMLKRWMSPPSGQVVVPPYLRSKGGKVEHVKGYTYPKPRRSAVSRLTAKLSRGPS